MPVFYDASDAGTDGLTGRELEDLAALRRRYVATVRAPSIAYLVQHYHHGPGEWTPITEQVGPHEWRVLSWDRRHEIARYRRVPGT